MLEDNCEWILGDGAQFVLHHKPSGRMLFFENYIMKPVALGLMDRLLRKFYS